MDERTLEMQIRQALEAEANTVEVRPDLAAQTVAAAEIESADPSIRERWQAWRDSRSVGGRVRGYPVLAWTGAAAVLLVALFAVGSLFAAGSLIPRGTSQSARDPVGLDSPETDLQGTPATEGLSAPGEVTGSTPRETAPSADEEGSARQRSAAGATSSLGQSAAPADPVPQLARSAEIDVTVGRGRFEDSWSRANEVAAEHGGFVTESQTEQVGERIARGTLTARVPASSLDAALSDFRALGTVARQASTGTDVSAQAVDLDARIRAAQAQENQLLELLNQARDVSDILRIRERLDASRTEIERLQAQKQQLDSQVELATVRASLSESGTADVTDDGLGDTVRRALDIALTIAKGAVLTLGVIVPLALIGLVLWLAVWLVRRRSA